MGGAKGKAESGRGREGRRYKGAKKDGGKWEMTGLMCEENNRYKEDFEGKEGKVIGRG